MKKKVTIFLSLLTVSITVIANAREIPPVQGFPDGESVLNKTAVPHEQPEPHLVYKNNGFNTDLLSPVPPVGVHPRVLMSPEDVPRIRENITNNKVSKMFWEQYILPMVKDVKKDEFKPITEARIDAAALYALVMDDAEYGKKVAAELVKRSQEASAQFEEDREAQPYIDNLWVSRTGKNTHIPQAYDFAHKFLDEEQRSIVRGHISLITAGRYNHGMELPRSWRTWNWPMFSQGFVNYALAIEGEEGFDERILEVCRESVTDFQTYKIAPDGWDFESTGYNGLAFGAGGIQSLLAIARRTSPSLLTHPHLQKKIDALIGQLATPSGKWQARGDSGGSAPQMEFTHVMRAAYPDDQRWKIQWANSFQLELLKQGKIPKKTGQLLRNQLGLSMLIYAVDMDIDKEALWNEDNGPLTYESPSRGYMATRSGWDVDKDVHLSYACYTKLRDTGHDGPDMGTFSLTANGVNWTRYGTKKTKYSAMRSYVAINGDGMGYGTPHGLWLPTVDEDFATAGRSDQSYSFTWRLWNGRFNVLYSPMFEEQPSHYLNGWALKNSRLLRDRELDATPFSKEFWSMASTNYGLWAGEDRHPTHRYIKQPVQRAFRSATLVRGDHPYVLTVDDLQVDDQEQFYTWLMVLDGDNELVSMPDDRQYDFPQLIIRRKPEDGAALKKGDPLLLVRVLQRNFEGFPTIRMENFRLEKGQRIVIPSMSVAPDFKVLVYPHRHGDPLPQTKWNATKTSLNIGIGKQNDRIDFASAYVDRRPTGGYGNETYYTITRDGKKLITVGGPPSLPQPVKPAGDFTGTMEVAFETPASGQLIHYTTDGSEPTAQSPVYKKPFSIEETTEVRAITVAADWAYGDANSAEYKELINTGFIENKAPTYQQKVSVIDPKASAPVSVVYTKVTPAAPVVSADAVAPGIEMKLYELPISIWRGSKVDLQSPLMPADLDAETPIYRGYQKTLTLPRVAQTMDRSKMYQGLYVINGYVQVPVTGTYDFRMLSCGPTRLTVAGKNVIDIPGPYHTRLTEREGSVMLEAGLHPIEAIAADPVFYHSATMTVVDFDLKMKVPNTLEFARLGEGDLFRDKDIGFNISGDYVELGQPFVIENQRDGELQISLDGGKSYQPYRKPLVFNETINVDLKVRRGTEGPVIDKPLQVVANLKAITKMPKLKSGMIRRSYLNPVPMKVDITSEDSARGMQVVSFPIDPKADNFAFLKGAQAETLQAVTDMTGDDVGGVVNAYTGYWYAPENGVYEFRMNYEGCSRLEIGGLHIASNNTKNARSEGKVLLEKGWHEISVMFIAAQPELFVKAPRAVKAEQLQVDDFFYSAELEQKPFKTDSTGKPSSFALGTWFLSDGTRQVDTRLKSDVFGAQVLKGDRPGARQLSGDKSMILVRDAKPATKDATVSMWIKPDELNGKQFLWNRQHVGWVYRQRGGFALAIVDGQLSIYYYGQGKGYDPKVIVPVKAGEWQHVAMTIRTKPDEKWQVEVWLDGQRVYGELYTGRRKLLDVAVTYMEFLGRVDRSKTEIVDTAGLGYDEVKDIIEGSLKGAAADVRYFDKALSDAAIKALLK